MRIREIWIKNFGRFTERKIPVSDGIQIFYGENEAGKSTIHTFLKGMLFGMERKRGKASATDESHRYEPWDNPNYYAGVLRFEAGGKTFCLQRSFEKAGRAATLYCEEDGEEFSVEGGDLTMLLDGLTVSGYENTISCGQLKVTPDASLGEELRNYATNACAADKGDMDLGAAFASLKERKKVIDRQIKARLEERQKKQENTEQQISYVWTDIHKYTEEQKRVSEQLAIRDAQNKKDYRKQENGAGESTEEPSRWRIHPVELMVFALLVILPLFVASRPWNYMIAIIIFLCCLIYIWNRMKISKHQEKTESEILLEEIKPEEEKVSREKLIWEKNRIESELKERQTQYDNLKEQLEELDLADDTLSELQRKRDAILLAYNKLEELSDKLRRQTDQLLNGRVSEIVCAMTGGKYERLFVEDGAEIYLLTEGKKIGICQVSRGTAEQIYLALRIAAAEFLYEEEFPLILDDTFGFYDENRLANTLKWLAENKKQVLIFTCQKREEEILSKLQIPYTKEMI